MKKKLTVVHGGYFIHLARRDRCGLGGYHFFTSSDVDPNTIRTWLGHVHLDTTNIYAEIDLQIKAEAIKLCDAAEPGLVRTWQDNTTLMDFLTSF